MTKKPMKTEITVAQLPQEGQLPDDPEKLAKNLLNRYIVNEIVDDFSQVPTHIKITLLQKTPKKFIQQKQIADKNVFYIPHQYSKKCLNFAFNFRVSNEVMNSQYFEYEEDYKKQVKDKTTGQIIWKNDKRNVIEAECDVMFTFTWKDGTQDRRTVHSSHKQYKNSAICRGDAMQSAISKAWTKVAATFGIGADLEDDYYRETPKTVKQFDEENIIESEETPVTVAKSFTPNF